MTGTNIYYLATVFMIFFSTSLDNLATDTAASLTRASSIDSLSHPKRLHHLFGFLLIHIIYKNCKIAALCHVMVAALRLSGYNPFFRAAVGVIP